MNGSEPGSVVYPVSVKGVVVRDDRVLLLRNEREEWELPGGRIETGETPQECVVREIAEEVRWEVRAGPILDAWVYHIAVARKHVFIVTYGCHAVGADVPILSSEHNAVGLFSRTEAAELPMPDGYRRSIATWFGLLDDRTSRYGRGTGPVVLGAPSS